jgi:hypothetical protein
VQGGGDVIEPPLVLVVRQDTGRFSFEDFQDPADDRSEELPWLAK